MSGCWLCPLRSISANASACFSLRLRSTLNALLQATMLRIRATNRTIVSYVRCARFSQMQALASLFACGQPRGRGFSGVAACASHTVLLNHIIASNNAHSFACVLLLPKSTKVSFGVPVFNCTRITLPKSQKNRQNLSGFLWRRKRDSFLSFAKQPWSAVFMLCKSLRAAAKNDALCRFLNALVRIPLT